MNVERLHSILRSVHGELEQTQQAALARSLMNSLTNLVNQPQAGAQYQQEVSTTLGQLRAALSEAPSNAYSPSWRQTLDELGVADLLGFALLEFINSQIEANQLTPTVAVQTLEPVVGRLEQLGGNLTNLLAGFEFLSVGTEDLAPGEVEVSVLIPRQAVNNDLRQLGLEILEVRKILAPFQELITGSRAEVPVRSIASTDFGIFVDTPIQVAAALAMSVAWLMGRYKELLEIRKLRSDLARLNVPDEAAQGINDHADNVMSVAIATEVDRLLENVDRAGRENELRAEFSRVLRQIAERIDQGYSIDVRAAPDPAEDVDAAEDDETSPKSGDQVAARLIREKAPELQFIRPEGAPILSLTARDEPDTDA